MRIYQSHGFFPGLLRNGAVMSPGDNIVLDPISHGANVWPWIQLAKALNVEVRYLPTHQEGFPRSGRMGSQLDVSKNKGTPKSSSLIGFSFINHPFCGTTIFRITQLVS